ncbi:MAG TPA: arginine deiminase-related protein, partial [Bacteroidia bacterium]|nr:arginine deiminase-related protein [Bacteroidia bacterium]
SFCGNALQLQTNTERPVLTMSTTAFNAFSTEQIKTIEKHSDILYSSIDTIESIGGGSVRCMLAEIFLNPKS